MPTKPRKSASKAGKKTSAATTSTTTPAKSGGGRQIMPPTKMTTHTIPPAGWPPKMPYLSISTTSPNLTTTQQAMLTPKDLPQQQQQQSEYFKITSPAPATFTPTANPLVQIRSITDPNHPAFPQCGLFAARKLAPGTHIVDYTGMIHSCPEPSCASSDYDLAFLDRDASLAIDSAAMGNEARFVNDYHGIRTHGPNAVFEEYFVRVKHSKSGKDGWQARMGIWVAPVTKNNNDGAAGIEKGEEICVSYGKGWWRARRALMDGLNEQEEEVGEDVEDLQLAFNETVVV